MMHGKYKLCLLIKYFEIYNYSCEDLYLLHKFVLNVTNYIRIMRNTTWPILIFVYLFLNIAMFINCQ